MKSNIRTDRKNISRGQFLHKKIQRWLNDKEPIKNETEVIHQERRQGVEPAYDIRTDRFEAALDAKDTVEKIKQAKREAKYKPKIETKKEPNTEANTEESATT